MHPFIEWVFGEVEAAHLLAWVTHETAWREELSSQVRTTLGTDTPPERVLVLDENVYEGGTWVMVLGLVHDTFPGVEAHFIAGRVGDESVCFDEHEQAQQWYPLLIHEFTELERIPCVVYAHQKPNLHVIVDGGTSLRTRARLLARLAIQSLTLETLAARHDGIQYLDDAIRGGIQTPLTPLYVQELLQQAGNAPDLETARLRLARQKGIV